LPFLASTFELSNWIAKGKNENLLVKAVEQGTEVTQVTYFDFFGASFWAHYPWEGGMRDFLRYTAHWEQEIILQVKDRYLDQPGK